PTEAKEQVKAEPGLNEYIEQLQRLQAEFENFKKREEKEKERFKDFAKASVLLKLVSFNDDFERAVASFEKADMETIRKGVDMMALQLRKILAEEGVQSISCVGEKLDPFRHEVLVQQEAEKEDGVVLEELQKGYLFKGNVLRTAKVKVCKCVKSDSKCDENKKENNDEKRDESKMENKDENTKTLGGK
ncbi:MAG: nucleotide exchange factor GrpE, partial [Candidatus Nanoarchaeia archaeon]|nr:nucleotide exchange factor GrpE [Candidatus Nanoarchaeia archaeon]